MIVHQRSYVNEILRRGNMGDAKAVGSPGIPGVVLSKSMQPQSGKDQDVMKNRPYANLTGALIYLVSCTRPDMAYSTSQLAKFMADPGQAHWNAVQRALKYLVGTADLGVKYSKWKSMDVKLTIYCDADFAADVDSRRSQSGIIVMINEQPVHWISKRQSMVALATCEAELMAITDACREAFTLDIYWKKWVPSK